MKCKLLINKIYYSENTTDTEGADDEGDDTDTDTANDQGDDTETPGGDETPEDEGDDTPTDEGDDTPADEGDGDSRVQNNDDIEYTDESEEDTDSDRGMSQQELCRIATMGCQYQLDDDPNNWSDYVDCFNNITPMEDCMST